MDTSLVANKRACIETCVRELHELALAEQISTDIRQARFVEQTLQIAIPRGVNLVTDSRWFDSCITKPGR